jgi:hypothetical protein
MLWVFSREKDFAKLRKRYNSIVISVTIDHTKSQSLDQIHHVEVEEQQELDDHIST